MTRDSIELNDPPQRISPGAETHPGFDEATQHRGWRFARRRWSLICTLLGTFFVALALGGPWTPRVVMPGGLSTPHAQIMDGTLARDRCQACHQNVTTDSWFEMSQSGHSGMRLTNSQGQAIATTMTDKCMTCHHERLPQDLSRTAHNLSPATRSRLTNASRERVRERKVRLASTNDSGSNEATWWQEVMLPNVKISQDAVECSVCHQEHHGAEFNLSVVTDARCQTCHDQQFGSFATSHPEFQSVARTRNPKIAFDHGKHANVHYPKANSSREQKESFDCRSCHVISGGESSPPTDPIVMTLPFEVSCASCHQESLDVQIAQAPALLTIPTLPIAVTQNLESWPAAATGFPDGKVSPWMIWMLQHREPSLSPLPLQDLSRLDTSKPGQLQQAVRLATAIRSLAIDLATDGQTQIFETALAGNLSPEAAARLARSFPPQLIRDSVSKWFGSGSTEAAQMQLPAEDISGTADNNTDILGGDLLGGDLLGGDLLSEDPLSADPLLAGDPLSGDPLSSNASVASGQSAGPWESELKRRFDAAASQKYGGWFRDDLTMSIRYRGAGHQDAVLKSLVEMSLQESASSQVQSLVRNNAAVKACLECHSGAPVAKQDAFVWSAVVPKTMRQRFTKFTHQPHLNVRGLQDCTHCHSMPSVSDQQGLPSSSLASFDTLLNLVNARPTNETDAAKNSDFVDLNKQACVKCHTQAAAGESCTTCHRYHVGNASLPEAVTATLTDR